MRLKDYLAALIDGIDSSPYPESHQISFDDRPPDATFIKGTIKFVDGSMLSFKEFVIISASDAVILKYGYHYHDSAGVLIFRYDNALDPAARGLSTYPSHKHTISGLSPANRPSHRQLFIEISQAILRSG